MAKMTTANPRNFFFSFIRVNPLNLFGNSGAYVSMRSKFVADDLAVFSSRKEFVRALSRSIIVTFAGAPTSLILPFSIRTAAGESTFPERGSSNRPAFINVEVASVCGTSCAAPDRNIANGRIRFTFRFICQPLMRCGRIKIVPFDRKF